MLPAIERTTRGLGGDIIILEEAAQFKEDFIVKTIFPIVQRKSTSLLAISTRVGDENYYSKMLDMKDASGKPLFTVFNFFGACEECIAAEKAVDCTHQRHLIPHWIAGAKRDTIVEAMKQLGYENAANEEMLGVSNRASNSAFSLKDMVSLFDRTKEQFSVASMKQHPSHVFVSMDPSGGGGSKFALCSGFFDATNTFIVCGLEAVPAKREMHFSVFARRHVKELERIFPNSQIVLIVEANLRFAAQNIIADLMEATKFTKTVSVMTREGMETTNVAMHDGNDTNLFTHHKLKVDMYDKLKIWLKLDKVRFAKEFQSTYNSNCQLSATGCVVYPTSMQQKREIKTTLRKQLESYQKVTKEPSEAALGFARTKVSFTGKVNGMQDDLCLALQLVVYWGGVFIDSRFHPKYIV